VGAKRKRRDAEPDEEAPFEAVVERLEDLVGQLEGGDLSLETSLEAFEEGVALVRRATRSLDAMERRIEALTEEGVLEPLASEGEEPNADDRRGTKRDR